MNRQIEELRKYVRMLSGIRVKENNKIKLLPLYNNNKDNLEFIYPQNNFSEKEVKVVLKNVNKYIEKNNLNVNANYIIENNSYNLKIQNL